MNKDWKELSILLVGCGSIGKRHARVLTSLGLTDIRACDSNVEQLASLIREVPGIKPVNSFEEGLAEEPDCVFILTPPKLHIPMAIKAINAKCHVFSEKPISDSMEGINELKELVSQSDKKMMVGLCFRYHNGLRKAKKFLDDGRIGRLISIRALMGEHLPAVRPDYKNLFSSIYSGAFDLMHDIDLAVWFANQSVKNVNALFGTYSDIGIKAPDLVEILIGFQDRCLATVHLDFFQQPRRRQIELIGTDGVMIVEFASWDEYTLSVYEAGKTDWDIIKEKTTRDDMFREEDLEFLQTVANDKPVKCCISEACKSLEVVIAAQNLKRS
jgi:predicted dehydrogenase